MTNDPMREWVLKDEILVAAHRWPVIIIFTLAGALLAVVAAFFWPGPYRANVEISVELNPYRVLDDQYLTAFTQAEFRNVDDYKHWQMLQLSIVVKSDPYMSETLHRLRTVDPYWNTVNEQELRNMLSANWRNAGSWLLSANTDAESRSVNAVETWRDVIIELTKEKIASSQSLFQLELTLRSLNDQLVEHRLRAALLMETLDILVDHLEELKGQDQNIVLSEVDQKKLSEISIQLEEILHDGELVKSSYPKQDATVGEYYDWVDLMVSLVEYQIRSLGVREEILSKELSSISELWEAGLQDGQGLSATMNLDNSSNSAAGVRQIKSYGTAALIGSIVGLLIWIVVLVYQVTRKGYQ